MTRMNLGGEYHDQFSYETDNKHIGHRADNIRQSLVYAPNHPSSPSSTNTSTIFSAGTPLIPPLIFGNGINEYRFLQGTPRKVINVGALIWAKEHAMFGNYRPELRRPEVAGRYLF